MSLQLPYNDQQKTELTNRIRKLEIREQGVTQKLKLLRQRIDDLSAPKVAGLKRGIPNPTTFEPSKRARSSADAFPTARISQIWSFCAQILNKLMKHKDAAVFLNPVDPVTSGATDYYRIIKKPMDLGTVHSNLTKRPRQFKTPLQFRDAVRLVWSNCRTYNQTGTWVRVMGDRMSDLFEKLWAQRQIEDKWFQETGEMDVEILPNRLRSFSMELNRRVNRIQDPKSEFEARRKLSKEIARLGQGQQLQGIMDILAQEYENIENVGEVVLSIEELSSDVIHKLTQYIKHGTVKREVVEKTHFVHEKTDSTRHSNDSKSDSDRGQEVDASAMVSATDNANKMIVKPTGEKKEINLDNVEGWQDLVKDEKQQKKEKENVEGGRQGGQDSDEGSSSGDEDKNLDEDIWSDFQSRAQRQNQREKELKDEEQRQKEEEQRQQEQIEKQKKAEQEAQNRQREVEREREMMELQAQTGEEVRLLGPFLDKNKSQGRYGSTNFLQAIGLRSRGKDESDEEDDSGSEHGSPKNDAPQIKQKSPFKQNVEEHELGEQTQVRTGEGDADMHDNEQIAQNNHVLQEDDRMEVQEHDQQEQQQQNQSTEETPIQHQQIDQNLPTSGQYDDGLSKHVESNIVEQQQQQQLQSGLEQQGTVIMETSPPQIQRANVEYKQSMQEVLIQQDNGQTNLMSVQEYNLGVTEEFETI
eukprot:TRINITY_DN6051_c0_g4_i2.p1 TRINITY_DN6051_c0_g4~~TRINITY_DN6051_c0_g4_i2.p1  ORF type:complete len:697 (-),score=125.83 TRINITY_DN6051_c0_g4_i2:397-2487(-)